MKLVPIWLTALMLTACIVPEPAVRSASYDLGNSPPALLAGEVRRPVLVVAEVEAPRRLESTYIYYRLDFANAQEPRPYANSRWTMPPPQLLMQRMKARLAREVAVVSARDAIHAPVLKVELDSFDQEFVSKEVSRGVLRLRASLISNRQLIAQRYFVAERPAISGDAPGGVQALTQAADVMLDDLAAWVLAEMPDKR